MITHHDSQFLQINPYIDEEYGENLKAQGSCSKMAKVDINRIE